MQASRMVLVIVFTALVTVPQQVSTQQASQPTVSAPSSCTLTPRPSFEFREPADYPHENLPENVFLIGSEQLWTAIREPMTWPWRPEGPGHEKDLTAKIFWFRVGYNWRKEPIPKLRVTGRRLDGEAPPLNHSAGARYERHHRRLWKRRHVDWCLGAQARLLGDHGQL